MRDKYCLPIIKKQRQNVLDEIEQGLKEYAFFEIWLDYIDSIDERFILELVGRYPNILIFVFRRQQLEPIHMPLADRSRLLRALNGLPAFVDLDLESQKSELDHIATEKLLIRVISYYHNYQKTPTADGLQQIAKQIMAHQPTILKIATYCNHEADALRLLELQMQLKQKNQRHIILGMGQLGAITRIFGTLWGNELIFAPRVSNEQSAPEELTKPQLDAIFRVLM